MRHFDTEEVEKVLFAYKNNPSEINLDLLYNSIDHIILKVTNKIASGFSKKFPSDFEDLQQNVRISIYKILPKLATISVSGNQVIAVVVKAVVWSFKSKYSQYKRKTPVKFDYAEPNDWMPIHAVGVEVQLELAMGGVEAEQPDENSGSLINDFMLPKVWKNPNQFETLYLKNLPDEILNKALHKNRYKDKESLVRFCLISLIEDRDASSILINKKWETSSPTFWTKYSLVLLKLAILETIV